MRYASWNSEYQRLRLKREQKKFDEIMKLVRSEVAVDTDYLYHLEDKEDRSMRGAKADALKLLNDLLIEQVVHHQFEGNWKCASSGGEGLSTPRVARIKHFDKLLEEKSKVEGLR